jgi:hypothetical protein
MDKGCLEGGDGSAVRAARMPLYIPNGWIALEIVMPLTQRELHFEIPQTLAALHSAQQLWAWG